MCIQITTIAMLFKLMVYDLNKIGQKKKSFSFKNIKYKNCYVYVINIYIK